MTNSYPLFNRSYSLGLLGVFRTPISHGMGAMASRDASIKKLLYAEVF